MIVFAVNERRSPAESTNGNSALAPGAGEWIKPQMRAMCFMIDGRTVGLLCFGAIARMVARRLAGFDCKVVYHDINRADHITERALGARWVPLEELIATGSIITAMPVVNAIASVVAARPGIVTYADLPPVTSILRPKPAV